jgi:Zn-finger nucleic acid-binding protein
MNRNNFGKTSGIVVDVCPRHGVWFDPGELPRILAFVQAGGLEQARKRAEQERSARERDANLAVQALRGARIETEPADDLGRVVGDALGELLAHVRSLFRVTR